jgi:hypothetical protein
MRIEKPYTVQGTYQIEIELADKPAGVYLFSTFTNIKDLASTKGIKLF